MQAPKKRTSKSKRDMRRTHDSITARQTTTCRNCGEVVLPHHVCRACGQYRERTLISVAAE